MSLHHFFEFLVLQCCSSSWKSVVSTFFSLYYSRFWIYGKQQASCCCFRPSREPWKETVNKNLVVSKPRGGDSFLSQRLIIFWVIFDCLFAKKHHTHSFKMAHIELLCIVWTFVYLKSWFAHQTQVIYSNSNDCVNRQESKERCQGYPDIFSRKENTRHSKWNWAMRHQLGCDAILTVRTIVPLYIYLLQQGCIVCLVHCHLQLQYQNGCRFVGFAQTIV